MESRILRTAVGTLPWILALTLVGCQPARPEVSLNDKADAAGKLEEAHRIAEASLGKQAEILAEGDLAQNGREQLLVINRVSKGTSASEASAHSAPILVTRAVILEKDGAKWSEILRCDEHLKNPSGYLGGSPAARVTGWQLEFRRDARQGLEVQFTPAGRESGGGGSAGNEWTTQTVVVRWNTKVKRYQSLDRSHERYLSEAPELETPQSILR